MQNQKQRLKLEAIWWVFTLIVLVAVLAPIFNAYEAFPFWAANILFIVVAITYTRFLFLLKHTLFSHNLIVKGILLLITIPLIFTLITNLYEFQFFLDEKGQYELAAQEMLRKPITEEARANLSNYVRNEFFLFAIASIIAAILLPIRLVISIWTLRNRGKV